jgi:gliding motility-associated protein GldM
MAGNKLSPRQKMIGMMYLVLIALLALNVSKTVLDAFAKINGSLYTTSINFSNKNNEVYYQFEQAAKTNPGKAGQWRDKAFNVKKESDALVETLQRLKFQLVSMGDGVVKLDYNGKIVEIPENTSFTDLGDKKHSPKNRYT